MPVQLDPLTGHVRRSTTIRTGTHQPAFRPENFMLLDPDQPKKDANQLAAELGGLTNPNEVQHNCPGCNKSYEWEIFVAHALPCYRKWWRVAAGWRRHRSFAGASIVTPTPKLITLEETRES